MGMTELFQFIEEIPAIRIIPYIKIHNLYYGRDMSGLVPTKLFHITP